MKRIYVVEWIDSTSNSRWYNDEEIDDYIIRSETPMISVGFLYKKTKKFIVLFGDEGIDERARFIKIPTGCIKSIHKLPKNINPTKTE